MIHIQRTAHVIKKVMHLKRLVRLVSRSSLGPGLSGRSPDHLVRIQPEVAEALVRKRPVVALESTVITHGMPYPENVRYST